MLEFDNLQMMFAYHYDWVLHLHYTFQEIIMSDNTTNYRVTIDIKSYETRNDLKKWINDIVQTGLDTEYGEELVNLYVDEMRD